MKRTILLPLLFTLVACTAMAQVVIGGSEYQVDTLFRRQLGPGIMNTIIRIPGYPLNVYLLEADMDNPYNRIETMQGQGIVGKTELLTTAAQRYSTRSKRVLAGCNANFWCVSGQGTSSIYMLGSPYGAVVRNDTIYTNTNNANDTWDGGPSKTAGTAIDHDKNLIFGHFTWAAQLASPKLDNPLAINKVNRRNRNNEMCLWNEAFGRTRQFETNWVSADETGNNHTDNYYLALAEGSSWQVSKPMTFVIVNIVNDADRQTLGNYEVCLTATGSFKEAMAVHTVGDTITITQGWTTNEPESEHITPWIENMVEGNAPVMHLGELTGRNTDEAYNSQVYSRTGYGCSADGRKLYMIVIDKSTHPQYGLSAGCSTTVMCEILKSLYPDVSEVVNYDAGGSAEMLASGTIINKTTEGSPRAVSNGWLLESIAPIDNEVATIRFAEHKVQLPIYASATPQVLAYNQYGDLINDDLKGFTLTCDEAIGTTSGETITAGGNALTGTLTATYNGITATVPIVTLAAQPAIAVSPMMLVDNREWDVDVTATVAGKTYFYDATQLGWSIDDPTVATINNGKIKGLKNGSTRISCQIGELLDTDSVTVEISNAPYFFQQWTEGWTLSGSGAKELVLDANGNVTFTYTSSRAPYVRMLTDRFFYSLPDTIGLTFNSTLPIEYVQVDVRNNQFTSINYQKFENGGNGFEPGNDYTLYIDMDQLGGADQLATFPIRLREIRFVPDKAAATAGAHAIHIKAFYAHYPVEQTIAQGDVNGDGRVNVSDVSALINMILGITPMNETLADVNGDGRVNVSDVSALINIILGIS